MLQFRKSVLGVITIVLVACSSMSINMPAVTESPTDTRLAGKIIWHELLTDTPAESRRFYSELFGWEFEALPDKRINPALYTAGQRGCPAGPDSGNCFLHCRAVIHSQRNYLAGSIVIKHK